MYQRILVPVDGSPTSTRGLEEAIRLAALTGGSIHLVHVSEELKYMTGFETYAPDVRDIVREAGRLVLEQARTLTAAGGIDATTFLSDPFHGRICDVILEQAGQIRADLMVLGTHGRRGVRRLFIGSDAEQIVRMADVPVLLVRGQDAGMTPT